MRKNYIDHYMGLSRDNGIAALLQGERTFDQVVRRNIPPNLDSSRLVYCPARHIYCYSMAT